MEKKLNQLGIGTRIAMLAIVPLIVAVSFAFSTANRALESANNAQSIEDIARFAPKVTELVHELQKERGRTAGFIGSGLQSRLKAAVDSQRDDTATRLTQFYAAENHFDSSGLPDAFSGIVRNALQNLSELDQRRRAIDGGSYTVPQMATYYTGTINNLLNIVKFMAVSANDPEIMRALTGYVGLLEAKERAGLERAMGNVGFNSGAFPNAIYNRFVNLIGQQQAFLSVFRAYAAPETVSYYNTTVAGAAVNDVQGMRDFALSTKGALDDGTPVPTNWFDRITVKIDQMKKVEDRLNNEIIQLASAHVESASSTFWTMSIVFSVGSIFVLGMAYVVFRSVAIPLSRIKRSMEELASGELEVHVPCMSYGSEIGDMAQSVSQFKASSLERLLLEIETKRAEISYIWDTEDERENAAREAQEQEARHKAAEEAEQRRLQRAMQELARKFEEQVGSVINELTDAAQSLESTSGTMIGQAEDNEACGADAASASRQTSANVQTVASAAEELTSSGSEISRQVSESKEISKEALDRSQSTSVTVEELAESSRKIEGVLGLITDIAEQTNLLALNATIEAARAGDAGKGFAVVAQEVKALADQTSKATDEIATQIRSMQTVSDDVSTAVSLIREIIQKTNDISTDIAESVDQQSAATAEISRSMQEASMGADQVLASVGKVQEVAQQTKDSSSHVRGSSELLMKHCTGLQSAVKHFMAELTSSGQTSIKT